MRAVASSSKFHHILGLLPAITLLIVWQISAMEVDFVRFFFSSPTEVAQALLSNIKSGKLPIDFIYTLVPTIIGFLIGVSIGTVLGLLILVSERIAAVAEWNVLVLGSIPIFAIAPMMIVWFGLGIEMKIAMAVLSTLFIALGHSYRGGRSVPKDLRALFVANGASERDTLTKLTLPMSLDWVFASLRLNANFALLGVFVGEYMASERGLGRAMLQAGSLYLVADVLAFAIAMMVLAIGMDRAVGFIESRRHRILQVIAVNRAIQGAMTVS